MPAQLTYPGVYIEEIPSGVRSITGVATSITAFVGYTAKGPANKAVRILSFGDFERRFGGLDRDSEISYAVQQFFLNGGMDAYIVRVVKNPNAASVSLKNWDNNIIVLDATAVDAGLWGNDLFIDVDYDTDNPDSTFNLTFKRYELINDELILADIEKHRNLSMNSYSSTYAKSVVYNDSKLVTLKPRTLGWNRQGYSLSGDLSKFSGLNAGDPNLISILIDGSKKVTLSLQLPIAAAPTPAASVSAIKNVIDAAVQKALGPGQAFLEVQQTNATATGNTGNFIMLRSMLKGERSSVQVLGSPANDVSRILKLGLNNGGREKDAAGFFSPAPTGTISDDIADIVGNTLGAANTSLGVKVKDASSVPPSIIAQGKIVLDAKDIVGLQLQNKLQESIRGATDITTKEKIPELENAIVSIEGSIFRFLPGNENSNNLYIELNDNAATYLKISTTNYFNVQQYRLGIGATFGAQTGAIIGSDGTPPNADDIIGKNNEKTGIYALRDVDLFNMLVIPRTTQLPDQSAKDVISKAVSFCEECRAFYIIDPDPNKSISDIGDWASKASTSKNAAVYFPYIQAADPLENFRSRNMPPSGMIAGIFARTDSERGVWKAPAGIDAVMKGAQGLKETLTDRENGTLNQLGINCLRTFPVYNTIVWGARTREGADSRASEWKYIPVRRMALFLEESLYRGLKWVVFEPNDEPLWAQIRLNIGAFMHNLFRQGAFQGKTPKDAYFVKCDSETTTQNDIDLGIVNILVAFAPLKPAEFVVIKIQQKAGQVQT